MKHVKKLLALALALAMTLSLGVGAVPAFAANDTGTITITNPKAGEKYTAYKIFDATIGGTTNNDATYAYTIAKNSPWYNSVAAYTNKGLTLTKVEGSNPETYNVAFNKANFSAPDFAKAMGDAKINVLDSGTALTNNTATVPYGYYLVITTKADGTDQQALCSLTSATPTASITNKNNVTFEKKAAGEDIYSAEVGEEVTFTLRGKVPDYVGYKNYLFMVRDTLPAELAFKEGSLKVYYQGDSASTDYTSWSSWTAGTHFDYMSKGKYTNMTHTFKVDFSNYLGVRNGEEDTLSLKNGFVPGKEIVIAYQATVLEAAVGKNDVINDAGLTYTTDPNWEWDGNKSPVTPTPNPQDPTDPDPDPDPNPPEKPDPDPDPDKTEDVPEDAQVYTAKVTIDKYQTGSETTKLEGAKFVLYKIVDGKKQYYKYTAAVEATSTTEAVPAKVEWISEDDAVLKETLTDAEETAGKKLVTIGTTNKSGAADFPGLKDGTYYLKEIEAPAGYNLLAADKDVLIAGTTTTEGTTTVDTTKLTVTTKVENAKGDALPATGGMGTTIFYILGTVLLLGAGVLMVTKKRVKNGEDIQG